LFIEKPGLAMRLAKEGGSVAALLRKNKPFGPATRREGILLVDLSVTTIIQNEL